MIATHLMMYSALSMNRSMLVCSVIMTSSF